MAHVIAFANHKGGCTKTTSASNIGAALALAPLRRRVLIIDTDPQANLSEVFGCDNANARGMRVEDALDHDALTDAPAAWTHREDVETGQLLELAAGVHVLPCTEALANVVFARMNEPDFAQRLDELCRLYDEHYDFILIDTPPGIQPLSTMALLAAHWVIVPFRPSDSEVGGAIKLVRLIEDELQPVNPRLKLLGTLMTDTDDRLLIDKDARAVLEDAGVRLLPRSVPHAVRVRMAPRYMAPIVVTEPDSRVGRAYRNVANDLASTLESKELVA